MSILGHSSLLQGGGRILSLSFRNLAISKPQSNEPAGVPKKPNTPWITYYASNYPTYKKAHPNMAVGEIIKLISNEWKKVPEGKKSVMMATYQKEKLKWNKQMESVSQEAKDSTLTAKRSKKALSEMRTAQTDLKELLTRLGKPKKPLTSYMIYTEERRPALPQDMLPTVKAKQMGEEWKKMTPKQKEPFEKKAAIAKDEHEKAMKRWNNKMEKEGQMFQIEAATARLTQWKNKAKDLKVE